MEKTFLKKIFIYILIIVLFTVLIATIVASFDNRSSKRSEKLIIYTPMFSVYDFTKQIGKDKVEVYNLTDNGSEAHGYTPTTEDMKNLTMADLIIINGSGLEGWLQDLPSQISSKIIDAGAGITLLEKNASNYENDLGSHDHDEDEHDYHDHGIYDPHTWLSVKNALVQIENIKNALVSADKGNEAFYNANYNTYKYQLLALDHMYTTELENLQSRTLVVSHAAFGYIAHDYNLTQIAISGIEHENEPSAETMANIITLVSNPENNIKTIYYQTSANSKVVDTIAKTSNVKVLQLHTAETLSDIDKVNNLSYVDIMYQNLYNLVEGLK